MSGPPRRPSRSADAPPLSKIRAPASVEHVLLDLLGRQQQEEQHRALTRALAQMGEVAVPGLTEALGAPEHAVRRHAAEVLVALGEPAVGALDALLAAAEGEDREVAVLALETLGPLDSPEVDEVLLRLREGPSR